MFRTRIILPLVILLLLGNVSSVNAQTARGRIYFNPAVIETANGNEFTTDIYISTDGAETGGAGVILKYNPVFLVPVKITPGFIYGDYPLAAIDDSSGTIRISGVSSSKNSLFSGDDKFAGVSFMALKTGTTSVSIEYEPGSTTDSNIAVTYGSGDILSEVGSLEVSIVTGGGGDVVMPPMGNADDFAATSSPSGGGFFDGILNRVNTFFGKDPEGTIDPYAPIARRDPITNLGGVGQEQIAFASNRPASPAIIAVVAVVVVFVLLIAVGTFVIRRKKNQSATTVSLNPYENKTPPSTPIQPPQAA